MGIIISIGAAWFIVFFSDYNREVGAFGVLSIAGCVVGLAMIVVGIGQTIVRRRNR